MDPPRRPHGHDNKYNFDPPIKKFIVLCEFAYIHHECALKGRCYHNCHCRCCFRCCFCLGCFAVAAAAAAAFAVAARADVFSFLRQPQMQHPRDNKVRAVDTQKNQKLTSKTQRNADDPAIMALRGPPGGGYPLLSCGGV